MTSSIATSLDTTTPLITKESLKTWTSELKARRQKRASRLKKDENSSKRKGKNDLGIGGTEEGVPYSTAARTYTPDILDFLNEDTWHRLPNSNADLSLTTEDMQTSGSSSGDVPCQSFAKVTGTSVDEVLHEQLHQQQAKGKKQKKKIVLFSTGGRRGV